MRAILGALSVLAACSTAAPDAAPAVAEIGIPTLSAPQGTQTASTQTASTQTASTGPAVPVVGHGSAPSLEPPPEPSPDQAPAPAASFDRLAEALRALSPDPAPERTTNDTHYLVSNERRHDLFRPDLDGRGGVMLGVGSDQSYVMAPWAGTELLVIVDFDQKIVDLHAIHGALMGAAATVEEFRRLWSAAGAEEAREIIGRSDADAARRAELRVLYDEARASVDKRLRTLARRYEELGVRSYLDTPEQYRHVADLHARGRVVALRGDFTRDGVLREVAGVLKAHGQTLEILYLSNIEQYFTYKRAFKDNMLALPFEDETLVLRTLPGRPAGFHYILQRGDDFHAWMRAPRVWSVYKIRGFVKGEPLEANKRFVAGPPPATH